MLTMACLAGIAAPLSCFVSASALDPSPASARPEHQASEPDGTVRDPKPTAGSYLAHLMLHGIAQSIDHSS
jgi:hypothetical protein